MTCPICGGKHACPSPSYKAGRQAIERFKHQRVRFHLADDYGALEVVLPVHDDVDRLAVEVRRFSAVVGFVYRIDQLLARPRRGAYYCLRELRRSGLDKQARDARGLWRKMTAGAVDGDEQQQLDGRAIREVGCRTLRCLAGAGKKTNNKATPVGEPIGRGNEAECLNDGTHAKQRKSYTAA